MQDLLIEEGERVFQLWQKQEGHLYVCGKIRMAAGVEEALQLVLQLQGEMTKKEAKDWMNKMRSEGRYQEDIFGNH